MRLSFLLKMRLSPRLLTERYCKNLDPFMKDASLSKHTRLHHKAMWNHSGGVLLAVIPTVAGCALAAAYIVYMFAWAKTELSFLPWRYGHDPPYQDMSQHDVRLFMNVHKGNYHPREDIEVLRKEIGVYLRNKYD